MAGRMANAGNYVLLLLLGLVVNVMGCTGHPESVTWRDDVRLVNPMPKEAEETVEGYLVVETETLPPGPDESFPELRPFFVYTEQGKFFREVRGSRTTLRPGRYIVVSRFNRRTKQTQVVIEAGRTTQVSRMGLADGFTIED